MYVPHDDYIEHFPSPCPVPSTTVPSTITQWPTSLSPVPKSGSVAKVAKVLSMWPKYYQCDQSIIRVTKAQSM